MKLRAADLELFLAIHRGGSIAAGAKLLQLNQSTASRRLSGLEARLGAALFVRTRDGVHLTALGTRWLGPAEAADRYVAETERASKQHTGRVLDVEVTLTSVHLLIDQALAPALPVLFERHPKLRVRLLASSALMDMSRLQADIAVRVVRPQAGDLIVQRLRSDRMLPLAAPALAEQLRDVPPERWPWINIGGASLLPPPVRRWQREHGIQPRLVVSSGTTLLRAVEAGVGVGWIGEGLPARARLVALQSAELPVFAGPLWMTAHRAQRNLPQIDAVWRWVSQTLSMI